MNDLIKRNGGAIATPEANPFLAHGEAARSTSIIGKLLKFSKGDWMAGEYNEQIPDGTEFVVNMDELLFGWVRWQDMKPTDQIMGKVAKAYQPPRRNELGDLDQSAWDTDEAGKGRDPWQPTYYALMQGTEKNEDQLYTFTTSSKGGMGQIADLCKRVGLAQQRGKTGVHPVVSIGQDSYPHPNKAYGLIKYPTFEIVGWVEKGLFLNPDAEPELPVEKAPPPAAKAAPAKPKAKARF